ncbi:MAG: DNA gyrase inhibitor YacG [Candidatus Thiodiazotropha sp. (ex Notomyrtea botanica)]|nr:DNA gyrase inhibitor YacG [Candidatus Thiodiazotropha sp. (ex Notomyrtea botanica)]
MNPKDSNQNKATSVPCPTCNKPVAWRPTSRWRPFCSERCRLIDLGDWLDENHRISEPLDGYSEDDASE